MWYPQLFWNEMHLQNFESLAKFFSFTYYKIVLLRESIICV